MTRSPTASSACATRSRNETTSDILRRRTSCENNRSRGFKSGTRFGPNLSPHWQLRRGVNDPSISIVPGRSDFHRLLASNSRLSVPQLTRNADIKLNSRASLQRRRHWLTSSRRTPHPPRPAPRAKPSGYHIPLGGFVFNPTIEPFGQHRDVHSSGMIIPGSPT